MKAAFSCAAVAAVVTLCSGLQASAQSVSDARWPSKPVRIIVGAAAGGPTDIVARIVADELSTKSGQTVVIENRPGAGHQIGMTAMANAEPDGYTLGVVTTPFVVNPAVYKKMPYETKDLKPVSLLASSPLVLVVPSSLPVKSVKELVALAKSKPGDLNMASPGNVTGPHLAGELFRSVAGVKLQHVPYRGGPQATTAVVRGEAQLYFDTPSSAMPHVASGAVRALAHTYKARVAQLPGLPTFADVGLPGVEFDVFTGIVVPVGVPVDIAARIEAALRAAVAEKKVAERLAAAGFVPVGNSSAEFGALISKELARWKKVVAEAGIAPQ